MLNLIVGGRYNWVGQQERLVYLGTGPYSGDRRTWYQFAKSDNLGVVWCEVLATDLPHIEETKD